MIRFVDVESITLMAQIHTIKRNRFKGALTNENLNRMNILNANESCLKKIYFLFISVLVNMVSVLILLELSFLFLHQLSKIQLLPFLKLCMDLCMQIYRKINRKKGGCNLGRCTL